MKQLPMRLGLALAMLAAVPATASAATVGGTTHDRDGTTFGTMRYRSGHGIANRVTVTPVTDFARLRITERAERLRATGECEQIDAHTAECPWTESDFALVVVVGSQADRVEVRGKVDAQVHGGGDDDVLVGNGDELLGDRGDDTLRGGRGWDRLHGGPGRDQLLGGGADRLLPDAFYDGETDAQAARDVFDAGPGGSARIDYSLRTRPLRIDLRDGRSGPERDVLRGVSGVTGGSSSDLLVGDERRNELGGGPGNDRLSAHGGDDVLDGGPGDDVHYGGEGDDRLGERGVTAATGADRFQGGPGADTVVSLDSQADAALRAPDEIHCDAADAPVESDAADRLHRCASIAGWDMGELEIRVRPVLTADTATFTLRCGVTEMEQREDPATGTVFLKRCRGRIALRGLDGTDIGSTAFVFDAPEYRTPWVEVAVPLTAAGRAALFTGGVAAVELTAESANGWTMPAAGYVADVRG